MEDCYNVFTGQILVKFVTKKKIPVRRPAFVNPLIPESPEEEEIFKQGECMSYFLVVCTSASGST